MTREAMMWKWLQRYLAQEKKQKTLVAIKEWQDSGETE